MNEVSSNATSPSPDPAAANSDRHNRVTAVAWMVGIVGVFGMWSVHQDMTIGAGIGMAGVAAAVAFVAIAIVKMK